MSKGYPRSRFEIIDQSQIQEITTTAVEGTVPVIMACYTSDKGTEKWERMYGLETFTTTKGPISFTKHGQAQLTVAEALRNGAYVYGKRLVSADATLANFTVRARVVVSDDVSYVYWYAVSSENEDNFKDAAATGYDDFDPDDPTADDGNVDVPVFSVAPMGRGISHLYIRINPEYVSSKSSSVLKYSFEVYEGTDLVESILLTMDPDIIIDGVAQAMNPKIKANSQQVQVKLYEDGLYALIKALAETATDGEDSYTVAELVDLDFLYGYDRKGKEAIGGLVCQAQSDSDDDQWTANMPSDIADYVVDLASTTGIRLTNGSFGTLTETPMEQTAEYEKLLLGAFGADTDADNFDTAIYDLDNIKPDAIFDCNYPVSVKNAIIDLIDFRGDMVFLCDLGMTMDTIDEMETYVEQLTPSKFCALYHNYFNVLDPYTKKEITVTMPYLLVSRMISHIGNGCSRPFAGIMNNITFSEIIEDSINFLPVVIPSEDQKSRLVEINVNYLNYYDGLPVMETMYTNQTEYTQLSYLHNIMAIQEIIKMIRTRCPKTRYTFLDTESLEDYLDDIDTLLNEYSTNFDSITCTYMADELYESSNIFYAMIEVKFKNFIQEEYFKIYAIS